MGRSSSQQHKISALQQYRKSTRNTHIRPWVLTTLSSARSSSHITSPSLLWAQSVLSSPTSAWARRSRPPHQSTPPTQTRPSSSMSGSRRPNLLATTPQPSTKSV